MDRFSRSMMTRSKTDAVWLMLARSWTSTTSQGQREDWGQVLEKNILFGHPPKDVGIVGEMVLDWVTQGFFDHVMDGGITKQAFGQRVHKSIKDRCLAFEPFNDVSLLCEPFFVDSKSGPQKRNPKGSFGVDVLILYRGNPVIAFEVKTGAGMTEKGFNKRRKFIGASVIQITLKPTRK